jgi:hypothetical protein
MSNDQKKLAASTPFSRSMIAASSPDGYHGVPPNRLERVDLPQLLKREVLRARRELSNALV